MRASKPLIEGPALGPCIGAGQAAVGTAEWQTGFGWRRVKREANHVPEVTVHHCCPIPAAALAAPPAQFLRQAIRGNFSEVTLGHMIQNRGSSAQVRHFGSILVSDHSKGLAQAQQIAARLHLRIPATLTPEARAEQWKLRRLGGRAFDREVRRYMINDHLKDISEFRAQARSGDRATSGYAAATIPVMQRHLSMARSISA